MYRAYNLEIEENKINDLLEKLKSTFYFEVYNDANLSNGKIFYDNVKNIIIEGADLEADWFPSINTNIFISHSHKDEELAKKLAKWLYREFELTCFVDSTVWGYVDDLLEQLNSKYSDKRFDKDGKAIYDHQKCNKVASHIYTILNIALQKMIDKTEVIIVFNTKNSINKYSETGNTTTLSPWIYNEIISTKLLRKMDKKAYRPSSSTSPKSIEQYNDLEIEHAVSLDHLIKLNYQRLSLWWGQCKLERKNIKGIDALDILYSIN